MPLFSDNVTKDEWDDADNFFETNPTELKYRKAKTLNGLTLGKTSAHSFIRFNNENYVLNNTQHSTPEPDAGRGGVSRVKFALNRNRKGFVVRIDAKKPEQIKEHLSEEILFELGQILSDRIPRRVQKEEESGILQLERGLKKITGTKFYTLLPYLGDRDLFSELIDIPESKGKSLSEPEYLVRILKAMMSINALHQKGIIHGDVKPENFMVNNEGETLTIQAIDFDFSVQLPLEETVIYLNKAKGSPSYVAPEILETARFSFASDVYAFGMILWGLEVNEVFYQELIEEDYNIRPSLMAAMSKIADELDLVNTANHNPDPLITKTLSEFNRIKELEEIKAKHNAQIASLLALTSLPTYRPSIAARVHSSDKALDNLTKLSLEEKQPKQQDNKDFVFRFG